MSFIWPKKYQWLQFFKILSFKEKAIFFFLLIIFFVSGSFLGKNFYLEKTKVVPSRGGKYIEGVVGFPSRINPLYAPLSEIDMALTELIFSGLLKYKKNGKLELDLAKDYKILEDGKVYEFYLKENLFWQDGKPLTADDIIFTVESIQNAETASPLRPSWIGIRVEKISPDAVRFVLKEKSAIFLENCTLKIIPKHIWKEIPPSNFLLSTAFNLDNPIGSGPFKLGGWFKDKKTGKIVSLDLFQNPHYYGKKPYLSKISFHFFENEKDLIAAFNLGEINGFAPKKIDVFKNLASGFNLYYFKLPRYFAVFLNSKNSEILKEKNVRLALNYGTNKEEILKEVFGGHGEKVVSPLFSELYGLKNVENVFPFDLEKATSLLEQSGFRLLEEEGKRIKTIKKEPTFQFKSDLTLGSEGEEVKKLQECLAKDSDVYPDGQITGYFGQKTKEAVMKFQEKYKTEILLPAGLKSASGEVKTKTREKLNQICFPTTEEKLPLKFSLITGEEEVLVKTANVLKKQWERIGFDVEIKTLDLATLERDILRKKEYEAILFGVLLKFSPDPFSLWHSSQRSELGLNLSNYNNREIDSLTETARKSQDEKEKKESLEKFQEMLLSDAPAIFLYNPYYIYLTSKDTKGIISSYSWLADSSQRFSEIESWYIKTTRVWQWKKN